MQLSRSQHSAIGFAVTALLALAACGGANGPDPTLSAAAQEGREIARTNGCAACHGRNGQGGPGPAFIGLYGSTVDLADGSTVVADTDYLFESIRDPGAKVVAGYGFPMPSNSLSDEQIESVIVFIQELANVDESGEGDDR